MDFVRVHGYSEGSLSEDPTFLIEMSDGKLYVSKGGVFVEHTNEYVPKATISDITNGAYMFYGCGTLTAFKGDLPKLIRGAYMFYGCRELSTFNGEMPLLQVGISMFEGCGNIHTFSSCDITTLTNSTYMFYGCSKLQDINCKIQIPKHSSEHMFFGCDNRGLCD